MSLELLFLDMTAESGHRKLKLPRGIESQNRVPKMGLAHAERAAVMTPPPPAVPAEPPRLCNCRRTRSLSSFITQQPCWTASSNYEFTAPPSLEQNLDNHGRPVHDFRSPSRLSHRRSHYDDLSLSQQLFKEPS